MSYRDDYRFLRIADALLALNQKVNLIGIIVEYGVPSRSKGTDWFCSLRIVDESHNARGFLVNIFVETQAKLPQVEAPGHIIQLSHVLMKTHNNETYALFNKKYSSFAMYEGKYGDNLSPYQISSKFQPRNQDSKFVISLRKWAESFQLDTVSKESVSLREIKEGEFHDLICKVLHISQVNQEEWMLFVWDGRDTPPLQIQSELKTEKENPLPLQLEHQPLSRDTLCRFPTIGSILRISVNQRNTKLDIPSLTADKWDYQKRLSSKLERMPYVSFTWTTDITDFDDELKMAPILTLMDILTCDQVNAKIKCVVRFLASLPSVVEYFRSPKGTYRIRLTLEDHTARIHAYLYAEDAELFFGGYPAMDTLTPKWNKLLGVSDVDTGGVVVSAPRNPPWVPCCIKSYYVDKSDIWGSRNYRIFNTKLVC